MAHAKAKGQSHSIAVFDDGGHPVALLRMDGNSPGATDFAMQKAAAVAQWRFSTANMGNAARETPGFSDAPLARFASRFRCDKAACCLQPAPFSSRQVGYCCISSA